MALVKEHRNNTIKNNELLILYCELIPFLGIHIESTVEYIILHEAECQGEETAKIFS